MADCPNCGTEVRPEWSLCPHCKVNMRNYAGPRGGYVHPTTPVEVAPAPVAAAAPAAAAAEAPEAPVSQAAVPAEAAAADVCPHCGAGLPSPDTQYCPQCGDPVSEASPVARMRRLLSNRYLVGALAVVFVLLIAGIVLAGQGDSGASGAPAQVVNVGALPSPTVTAVVIRNTSAPTPAAAGRSTVPGAANASRAANVSGNATPYVNETVAVFKTLDRYIQNAGGDPSQLLTPTLPATPTLPSPVPTSASGPLGALSWSGEGTYVTEPFSLNAGAIYVQINAGVLTMVQLRDAAGSAIGIATGGPQPSNTTIQVPVSGTYRLEVWPFGAGPWAVTISYVSSPTAAPTLAPVTVTSAVPIANATTEVPTMVVPTTLETLSVATTEVLTTVPTTTPTQVRQSFNGVNGSWSPALNLNAGLAVFSFSTEGTGSFTVTLIDPDGEAVEPIAFFDGPGIGSKSINVPESATYHLNVNAPGIWTVSVE